MPRFASSKLIAAPIAETFALFIDIDQMAGRIKAITKSERITTGPIGLGTKFKETRVVFKREATETFEFTAFERNCATNLQLSVAAPSIARSFVSPPKGRGRAST